MCACDPRVHALAYYVDARTFPPLSRPAGFDYKDRAMRVNRKDYVVKIWDTAGSERFDSVTAQYYNDMEGFFIVFDVTNAQSFKNAERWIAKIKVFSSRSLS